MATFRYDGECPECHANEPRLSYAAELSRGGDITVTSAECEVCGADLLDHDAIVSACEQDMLWEMESDL